MEAAFDAVFWIWAVLCPLGIRVLIVAGLTPRYGNAAFGAAYLAWLAIFAIAMTFVGWSGMQMYGFDRSDPWQIAGSIALVAIVLPLLFGGPLVLLGDLLWFSIVAIRKPRSRPTQTPPDASP